MFLRRHRREAKIQENVSANVIPMVDIMFLLVLFFMLAADMSQRELEIVPLPQARSSVEDEAVGEKRVIVHVIHRAEQACHDYEQGIRCGVASHWGYTWKGTPVDIRQFEEKLGPIREEWDREQGTDPKTVTKENPSNMPLMIRADQAAPYGHVEELMIVASKLFIYKTSVGTERAVPR